MALDKRVLVNIGVGAVATIAIVCSIVQCSGKKAEAFKAALEKVVQKDTVVAGENKNTVAIDLGQGAVNNGNIVVVNGGTENKSVKARVNNNDVNVKLGDATKNNGNIVATNDESVDKVEAVVNNNCRPVAQPVAKQPVKPDTVTANKKKYYVITSVAVVKKVKTVYRER